MFAHIHRQLTLLYTVLTAMFLCLFALAFYFGLSHVLLREQSQDALRNVARQASTYKDLLEKPDRSRDPRDAKSGKTRESLALTEDERLLYVISTDGRLIWSREAENISQATILNQVAGWKTEQTAVISLAGKDGQPVRLMLAAAPVIDDGRSRGMVLIGRDLAAYDRTLGMLAQGLGVSALIFVLLSGIIGYITAGRALIPIRQSFAAQRQFVADASHELRTPLSVFQLSLEALRKKEQARMGPESINIVNDLTDEVHRMTRLVVDLLTLARADAGAVQLHREQFDARLALESTIRQLSAMAEAKKINLCWTSPDEMPVLADRDRLVQLVYVLVDNAIKYTAADGRVEVKMTLANRGTQSGFQLEVIDNGIGMTKKESTQVFERFFRADKTRSRESGGFGLGLAIASWIVAAHGGTLSVDSKPGEGSTFTAFFPSSPAPVLLA